MKMTLLTSAALLAAVGLTTAPAFADTIVTDQWYDFGFGATNPSAVFSPGYTTGTDGPLPSGATGNSIFTPTGTSWTITLPTPGTITLTDEQENGDRFQVFVNSVAAIPATSTLTPPGQAGLAGGYTSSPSATSSFDGDDIGASLSDPDMSSGTFSLPTGTDTISATWIGVTGNGDGAFIVEVPEPASIALLAAGVFAVGLMRRRRA